MCAECTVRQGLSVRCPGHRVTDTTAYNRAPSVMEIAAPASRETRPPDLLHVDLTWRGHGMRGRSYALKYRRDALAAANTHRCQCVTLVCSVELIDRLRGNNGSGSSHRVPQRNA